MGGYYMQDGAQVWDPNYGVAGTGTAYSDYGYDKGYDARDWQGYDAEGNQVTYGPGGGWTNGWQVPGWQDGGGGDGGGAGGGQSYGGGPGQGHAGGRDIGQVKWGEYAGLTSWLNQASSPQQRQQRETYLQQMGLMPQTSSMDVSRGGSNLNNMGVSSADPYGGSLSGRLQAGNPYAGAMLGPDGSYRLADGSLSAGPQGGGGPMTIGQARGNFAPVGMGGAQIKGVGLGSTPMGGGQFGGGGPMGLPLEGQTQGAIGGILNHPSPFSDQQTSMLQSQFTRGMDDQRNVATQRAQEDAVRRGLSPDEVRSTLGQIGSQYDRAHNEGLNEFNLMNAQATRQGLMGGIGAAGGLMGTQVQNEDSMRRYLAMLGATQAGTGQGMLGGMMSAWG